MRLHARHIRSDNVEITGDQIDESPCRSGAGFRPDRVPEPPRGAPAGVTRGDGGVAGADGGIAGPGGGETARNGEDICCHNYAVTSSTRMVDWNN